MAFELDQLFGAVDIILKDRLADIQYDKTIIGAIVDDSDKKNGHYIVTDGSMRFDAYSENTKYRNNEQVRVSVPNGDYTQKKYISGKYLAEEATQPISYVSPSDSIVQINDDIIQAKDNTLFSIRANNPNELRKILWTLSDTKDLFTNSIINSLVLKASFKTLLPNKTFKAGNYGLRLSLLVLELGAPQEAYHEFYTDLDSSEMFGNPYSFSIYSQQEKVIDISTLGEIKQIAIELYQNNNFVDVMGNRMEMNQMIDDILVKDITIGLGNNIEQISDNTLQIYSSNSLDYTYTGDNEDKSLLLLWYNKDNNNKYIGFNDCEFDTEWDKEIDGKFDTQYNEVEYRKASERYNRLSAQLGKEGIPQDEQGLTIAANFEEGKPIFNNIYKLFSTDLYRLIRQMSSNIREAREDIFGDALTNYLADNGTLATGLKEIEFQQNAIESYYKDVFASTTDLQKNKGEKKEITEVNSADYYNAINSLITSSDGLFKIFKEKTLEGQPYNSYQYIYDSYKLRYDKIITQINSYVNDIIYYKVNTNNLTNYYNRSDLADLPAYDINKEKEKLTKYDNRYCLYWYQYSDKEVDTNSYSFLGNHWSLLKDFNNQGLPRSYDGEGFWNKRNSDATIPMLTLDKETKQTRIMAILFYNHEMYKSNELVFTNSEADLIPDKDLIDKLDALTIKHGENSQDNYPNYDIDDELIDLGDASRERELICSYDGLKTGNEVFEDALIYWYVPIRATLLAFDEGYLKNLGFSTDYDYITNGSEIPSDLIGSRYKEGFTYFSKIVKLVYNDDGSLATIQPDLRFYYKIARTYAETARNNIIDVWVYLNGQEESKKASIPFSFSTFGTSGIPYSFSIQPVGNQIGIYPDSDLKLQLVLKDSDNKSIEILDSDSPDFDKTTEYAYDLKLSWFGPETSTFYEYIKTGVDTITVKYKGQDAGDEYEPYFAIFQAQVTLPTKFEDKAKYINLTAYYPISFSARKSFYIDGPAKILYSDLGTSCKYSQKPYKLYNYEGNLSWEIEYLDGEHKYLSSEELETIDSYLPILLKNNRLKPAGLYYTDLNEYAIVKCKSDTSLLWAQPILIIQNKYNSTTLNNWSGSLVVDDNNNYILTSMLGAGKKDSKNRFTGILMGDMTNADASTSIPTGLYGYKEGAQSFGFRTDGTAFIGTSGSGRIEFDGTKGVITTANWSDSIPSGIYIDLKNGIMKIRGNNKDLFYIKPNEDEAYYLQSSNFDNTQGTRFDLVTGALNAYNFKLTSNKILIDSSPDNTSSYFQIKNGNNILMDVGSSNYYLQSDGYTTGSGFYFGLTDGRILANDFYLQGGEGQNYITITHSPSIQLVQNNKSIFNIDSSNFILQSKDWSAPQSSSITREYTTYTCINGGFNIRLGAGMDYGKTGNVVNRGTQYRIYRQSNGSYGKSGWDYEENRNVNWYEISTDNMQGRWVSYRAFVDGRSWSNLESTLQSQNKQTISIGTSQNGTGMQIDINNGQLQAFTNKNDLGVWISKQGGIWCKKLYLLGDNDWNGKEVKTSKISISSSGGWGLNPDNKTYVTSISAIGSTIGVNSEYGNEITIYNGNVATSYRVKATDIAKRLTATATQILYSTAEATQISGSASATGNFLYIDD